MDADELLKERGIRRASRYLHDDETVIVTVNRHWLSVIEPVITAVLGLFVIAWVSSIARPGHEGGTILTVLWLILLGRALWRFLEWRRAWFISTDERLFKLSGVFITKVAMMPLKKVTDITYRRSIAGKIFGYGTFVLETPGQDQAFSEIELVPQPDGMYRAITRFMMNGKLPPVKVEEVREPEGSASEAPAADPDTEPFVIPRSWQRTDDEVDESPKAPLRTHQGRAVAATSPIITDAKGGRPVDPYELTGPVILGEGNRRRLRKR